MIKKERKDEVIEFLNKKLEFHSVRVIHKTYSHGTELIFYNSNDEIIHIEIISNGNMIIMDLDNEFIDVLIGKVLKVKGNKSIVNS